MIPRQGPRRPSRCRRRTTRRRYTTSSPCVPERGVMRDGELRPRIRKSPHCRGEGNPPQGPGWVARPLRGAGLQPERAQLGSRSLICHKCYGPDHIAPNCGISFDRDAARIIASHEALSLGDEPSAPWGLLETQGWMTEENLPATGPLPCPLPPAGQFSAAPRRPRQALALPSPPRGRVGRDSHRGQSSSSRSPEPGERPLRSCSITEASALTGERGRRRVGWGVDTRPCLVCAL